VYQFTRKSVDSIVKANHNIAWMCSYMAIHKHQKLIDIRPNPYTNRQANLENLLRRKLTLFFFLINSALPINSKMIIFLRNFKKSSIIIQKNSY